MCAAIVHNQKNITDALPTPQRIQMWAQVERQRNKEELEHAP